MLGSALAQAKIYGWRENSNNNKTHSISREIMASLAYTKADKHKTSTDFLQPCKSHEELGHATYFLSAMQGLDSC